MKYYEQLLGMGCFTWDELCKVTGNQNSAGSLAQNYLKKGYIKSVRRGLYVAMDLATKEPSVSKFRIASKITPTSYVSHHAAFEYYGCANQVSYQVEVSSDSVFVPFNFTDTSYAYIASRISDGVTTLSNGVRITDMERTVLDSICDFEKVMGLEELLRCIELIPTLRTDKLLAYLSIYDKQVLYQKAGYILEHFKSQFDLSNDFFDACVSRVGESKRYLYHPPKHEKMIYNRRWKMIVPVQLMGIIAEGVDENADI